MSEMLQRVSAAISGAYECRHCGKLTAPINRCQCAAPSWDEASPKNQALAAIEAMREPTDLITAAFFDTKNRTYNGDRWVCRDSEFQAVWKAMIDAAVK